MKTFAVTTTIHAAADVVWALLTDAPGYPSWNSTVSGITGRIAPGETLTVAVKAAPGRAFPVKVVAFERPTRLVWSGGMPLGLFTGERTFELRPAGPASVDFSMAETYTGPMAPLIVRSIPDLQPAFEEFAACLKARAEAG